jgi:subtilisin family serine protease
VSRRPYARPAAAAAIVAVPALLAGVLAPVASAAPAELPAARAASPAPAAPASVPGELLVGYEPDVTATQTASVRSRVGSRLLQKVVPGTAKRRGVERVTVPVGTSPAAAIAALEAQPGVAYAEPNWILTRADASDDPSYTGGSLWGMGGNLTVPASTYGSQAAEAWRAGATGSSSVYVGVIDEGIDVSHPDLAANIWTNPYETVNGVDDDGNGYIDDVNGWDFVNNDKGVYDAGYDSHGTHVAGTIGGVGGNGIGVAGVSWKVTLISGKFLGASGGTIANAVKAVEYMTDLKVRHGLDIVATSNSWGGGGYSSALQDAINRAAKADILFIAAAGNSGTNNDTTASYPATYSSLTNGSTVTAASYDSVVSVAAIDSAGAKASFSQYGATTVDLGAPGVSIVSTLPGASYGAYSGTSMATPHVSGAAALMAATWGLRGAKLKAALLSAVAPTASLAGRTLTGGRLDLSRVAPGPDSTAPTAAIGSPAPGASVALGSAVSVSVPASDDRGVLSVDLYATAPGGSATKVATDTAYPFAFAWTPSTAGAWSLQAVATDVSGLTAAGPALPVTVPAPVVAPTGLRIASLSTVVSGTGLVITASVVDNLGRPVRSASVSASLFKVGTAKAYKTFTGTTSTTGVVTWKVSLVAVGCYSTTITKVSSGKLVWDKVSPTSVTSPCR